MPTPPPPPNRPAARPFCRRSIAFLALALCSLLANGGCRSAGKLVGKDENYDLLTAELRTREREILELRGQLQYQRELAQTYQRQVPVWPTLPGPGAGPGFTPGFAQHAGPTSPVPTLPLKDITLGNGTGGVDEDGRPGDESLMVAIVPRDGDGSPVKVPGNATITAFEINAQGLKCPIGRWEVSPDQLRRAWKGGLLATGYFVPLQWDKLPGTDRVRIVARFTSNDGQTFEADKDVTVRPQPGAVPAQPPVEFIPGPPPPTPTVPLPPRGLPPQDLPVKPAEELPPPQRSAARLKWLR